MANILVGDVRRYDEDERRALTEVDQSAEGSSTTESDPVHHRSRTSRFFQHLCGRRSQTDRHTVVRAVITFGTLSLVLIMLVLMSMREEKGAAESALVLPMLLLVSVGMSLIVQCVRACSWAWVASAQPDLPPATRGRNRGRGTPRADDPAEAHIAFALRRTLGNRARALGGPPEDHGLDPFIAQQLRASGMDDIALSRVSLLLRDGDFRPEDYEALLQLDETSLNMSTALFGPGSSRRGTRMAGRGMGGYDFNPQAAQAHEINRLPTYVFQPRPKPPIPTSGTTSQLNGSGHALDHVIAVSARSEEAPPGSPQSSTGAPWCIICIEHVQAGQSVRLLPCMHSFHTSCVDEWLNQKATCPVCKISVRDPVWSVV